MGIVGDGRGWLVGKIQRGDGGSDVAWWENRGVYWIGEMGENRGKEEVFFFFR